MGLGVAPPMKSVDAVKKCKSFRGQSPANSQVAQPASRRGRRSEAGGSGSSGSVSSPRKMFAGGGRRRDRQSRQAIVVIARTPATQSSDERAAAPSWPDGASARGAAGLGMKHNRSFGHERILSCWSQGGDQPKGAFRRTESQRAETAFPVFVEGAARLRVGGSHDRQLGKE
jgi:hypothetical protein